MNRLNDLTTFEKDKLMKFEITFGQRFSNATRETVGPVKIFTINSPRPNREFPIEESEQKVWLKEFAQMRKAAVKEAIESLGMTFEGFNFNAKLGCSCGCSPGYVKKQSLGFEQLSERFKVMYVEFK
jgi:hypothetical protein